MSKPSILKDLGFGAGSDALKVVAHAVSDAGGNHEHIRRLLSEEGLASRLANRLVELKLNPINYRFEVVDQSWVQLLNPLENKLDRLNYRWRLDRLVQMSRHPRYAERGEYQARLAQPRFAGVNAAVLSGEIERQGLAPASLRQLAEWAVKYYSSVPKDGIRVFCLGTVFDNEYPYVELTPSSVYFSTWPGPLHHGLEYAEWRFLAVKKVD